MTNYLKEFGGALVASGYAVIPIKANGKAPSIPDWSTARADKKQVSVWAQQFPQGGVGILTKDTPAIDLDIRDQEVQQLVLDWIAENIGKTAARVGKAPKSLLVYRTDTPFKKISSRVFTDFLGIKHQVEILGDGQQFVAFGTHPETQKPYQWFTETPFETTARTELPILTEEQAHALIAYFESIVPADWSVFTEASAGRHDDTPAEFRALRNSKPKIVAAVEQIRECLNRIECEDYHQWVRVGMALYHQFDGDAEGLELWDDWSQKGATYKAEEIPRKWKTFEVNLTGPEPVTAATILHLGRTERDAKGSTWTFLDRYIYVRDGNQVCDLQDPPYKCLDPLDVFKNATAHIRHEVPAPTQADPDKTRLEPVWKSWMVNPDRKIARGVVYSPKDGRIVIDDQGLMWINTFHMPVFPETTAVDRLAVIFDHMEYLFPIEREREWFLDWMAFGLQFPDKRCKVTPLHVSLAHGTGRGFLVELLGALVGQWNCTRTKMEVLAGDGNGGGFHEFLSQSLICAIDEVREGTKRYSVSDRVRDLLTENHLEINLKFGAKQTQRVYTNFFFMSNHKDAIVLPEEDRRINVFEGPEKPQPPAYYDTLYAFLGDLEGLGQLHWWLRRRDLKDFDWKRSMDTPARQRMINNNRTETEQLFRELLANPPGPAMTFGQIVTAMRNLSEKDFFSQIDEAQLTKLLQNNREQWAKMKIGGKTVRPWILSPDSALTNDAVRESVEKCPI